MPDFGQGTRYMYRFPVAWHLLQQIREYSDDFERSRESRVLLQRTGHHANSGLLLPTTQHVRPDFLEHTGCDRRH